SRRITARLSISHGRQTKCPPRSFLLTDRTIPCAPDVISSPKSGRSAGWMGQKVLAAPKIPLDGAVCPLLQWILLGSVLRTQSVPIRPRRFSRAPGIMRKRKVTASRGAGPGCLLGTERREVSAALTHRKIGPHARTVQEKKRVDRHQQ